MKAFLFYYAQKTIMHENRLLPRNINKIKGLINTLIILSKIKKKHDFKVLFYEPKFGMNSYCLSFLK